MKINVASKNPVKVEAVKEIIGDYEFLRDAKVEAIAVSSNVSEQPKSLEETLQGASNRAKAAFNGCDYSFGIESGLMSVPYTKTGSMNFCACVIYDGKQNHIGLSSAFELPIEVTRRIKLYEIIDSNQAFYETGLTDKEKIGSSEGAIGLLTKGRLKRKDYIKEAIQKALIHLDNPGLY